ncbi:MAG: N-acetyltransferase family protein [Flavobacteriaceae bacterium]|nr:N-acetyltransferase family protein [Flavobacteriaceae bacterium]
MIRKAKTEDLPAVVDIYNQSIPHRISTADLHPLSVDDRKDWWAHHQKPNRPLWVSETDGEIAGWIGFQDFKSRCAYDTAVEISIYLADKHKGKGLSKLLMEHALQEAKAIGLKHIAALVFGHNLPSISLFQKYGFVQWGLLPGIAELDGIRRDLLILGWTSDTKPK